MAQLHEFTGNHWNQMEEEEFTDIEAAREAEDITMKVVHSDLLPEIGVCSLGGEACETNSA